LNLGERKRELDTLFKGFIVPVFEDTDPTTGQKLHGLSVEDFEKVAQGYGCPACLAEYTTYLVRCPVCGYERDVGVDIQRAPEHWQQHLEDRASGYQAPIPNAFDIDEHLARVGQDPNVEQIPLKKLKPTRRGARRS
jgi:hypothetical protein